MAPMLCKLPNGSIMDRLLASRKFCERNLEIVTCEQLRSLILVEFAHCFRRPMNNTWYEFRPCMQITQPIGPLWRE